MPSKSSSDFSLHKLRGFHSKRQSKKTQTSTPWKTLNASTPFLQPRSQPSAAALNPCSIRSQGSTSKESRELCNLTQIQSLDKCTSSQSEESVAVSESTPKNCFKYFCTSAVKQFPHLYSSKDKPSLTDRKSFVSGVENGNSRVKTHLKKTVRKRANKVLSLPNDLTVEAIQYKCKILQLHDTKCGCSSPRLHIYLTTNHRCGDKCSPESYHCVDSLSPSSSVDVKGNKYVFAVMTGKSKARGQLRKVTNIQKARKNSKRKTNKPVTKIDFNFRRRDGKTRNEEPESELLGEECESLPTIMSTLSGDVEYIVLDDNTFNLSANSKNDVSHGAATSRATGMFDDKDVKPDIQTLEKAMVTKEGRNWEDILERCLSEVSYQSGKNKGFSQPPDTTKVKCEQPDESSQSKSTETSSLAEVCTNHCPSIRDIFGDVNIKDEPVDAVEDNDMSIEDFSQEIRKLTDSEKRAENTSEWPISKVTSLKQQISANKGLFAGLLKEETKPSGAEEKDNIPASSIAVKEEKDSNNQETKDNEDDDDYSSDSSLAPLQIDEGEPAPAEEETNNIIAPVVAAPATSLILPSVNIISPFKIKIFFGTPHRVQLEKQHELFDPSVNASVIATSNSIQNGVVTNKSTRNKQHAKEDEESEAESMQTADDNESGGIIPNLTCMYCDTVSPDVKALAKHFEDHQLDGLIICYFCQKSFGDKTSMKRHMRTHTGEKPYQCKVCGKRFSLPGNFKKHRDIHEDIRTEPCELCGKTFRRKEHLKYHMRTHTGEKPYTCTECGTSFTARYSLQIHMNIHLGKKPYKCNFCSKAFSDKSTMRKHVRVHTGEKPFHCDICGRCFGESGTLGAHMATHRSERPYKCKQCPLCFKTSGGLRQHEKIHTGDKQYACKYCGVRFLQKYNMTMHERIHTGEKPYACNHCNRNFRSRSCLAKHVVLHGGQEERRYECEHCNSRFYRKAHLRRHIDMHLGIKNYECDICSKKFCTRVSLANHLKTFHAQGARRFPCPWCGRVFKRKVYVNTHECIRDPVKVEQYKQELKAAAAAAAASGNNSSQHGEGEIDNSTDTDYSSIDIKSEPEEEDILEESSGLGEIESVVGNVKFDIEEGMIKPDPS